MRHLKRKFLAIPIEKLSLFFITFTWSFLLILHFRTWNLLLPLWGILTILGLYIEKFFQKYFSSNRLIVETLISLFAILIILVKLIEIYDPLKLFPFKESYYLAIIGVIPGILTKAFIRRKSIYPILFITAFTLLCAKPDLYIFTGFILANLVASDFYEYQRNTVSEITAVIIGNLVFTSILIGKWLQIAPSQLWKVPFLYLTSTVIGIFLVFGLQKLLDLIPFMYSDEKLEKLANLSNPLIEEMMLRAPGTYHHSVMVSILSESLAKKLGADPLLTRVGAMFHDIGKLINPQYFIENINGENPHKYLKPEVSASIIKNHVDEGISLAKKYKLPDEIISFIPEHQGTKLIKYFYYKALEENPKLSEEKFRYPGPIPQSKETAIVMIVDTIEAMVRALKNPTPEDIRNTVKKALKSLEEEGQLKNANLSQEDLKKIATLLTELLISYYHQRIKYPEKPTKKQNV